MNLLNETCNNCIYGDGKPIMCNTCKGMLMGGFCLPCNLKAENSFICDQNAYSFNDTSNNSNHLPQPQYENYLCNLRENNSHDGYDYQQQFAFVYEQEPSYNQNYDDNYHPHDSQVFLIVITYPEIHPPSQEISDEVFQAKRDLMKSIQTFLEEFNYIPFEEKPQILLQAWYKFFTIQYAQPEDSNELFQKLLEDLQIINKELKYNRPTFSDNNKDHSVQYKEYLENSSKEIAASNSNQEKEKPPQDSDIRQLIREECCIEVCEERKQNMENTILKLVEICHQKELLCMHDNVNDLIKSILNSKLLSINSQRLDKKEQEVKNVVKQPAERRTQPEYSPCMGYEHPNTTPEMESDEIIKSGVEELVPILSENEVTSEDKRECDVPVCENSPICDDHSEIFSDSKNNDDISSDNDDFEGIKYVEALLPDPEIVSIEEENDVHQQEEEFDFEEIQDVVFREKLWSINRLIANIESLNDNPTPDQTRSDTTTHVDDSLPEYDSFCFETEPDQKRLINVVKNDISDDSSNDPLLEEADLFLASDNSISPGIENFAYDSEGDIRFLEALLSDDSIPFLVNESSESDNPSFSRPPPEPPDVEFDFEEKILDEFECLNPNDEFNVSNDENDDYFPFMFVIRIFLPDLIYPKVFPLLLFAESEYTIFDPGKDYAQNVKNQSNTGQYQHKIGSLQQKPDQRAFFLINQAMKHKKSKDSSSGSILSNCLK
nr:hypothetical protein [Tanacetum cinerariifolium]